MGGAARSSLLVGVVLLGLVAFLGIRPHQAWILWLTAALTALASDGIVRSHPRWDEHQPLASSLWVALPALGVLGAGFFIDEALEGFARPGAAVVPALGVGLAAYAEYASVNFEAPRYHSYRLGLAIATYLAAFAIFTVIYSADIPLAFSAALTGLVAMALTLDLLRENRLFGEGALLLGFAVGLSLAELRLVLYFYPLDDLLAGALLIIGFYLATGLVHHLLDHDLEWSTAAEYVLVAIAGTAAVVITRVFV